MKKILPLTILLSQLFFAVAHANTEAAHHDSGIPVMPLVYGGINFLALLLILVYFLRKPMKEFFASRSVLIAKNIEEAQELKVTAEKNRMAYQARLHGIEAEIQALSSSIENEGQLERDRLIQTAQDQVKNLQGMSEKIIAQEVSKAKEELKQQAVILAADLAEKIIRERITPEDQKRLLGQYLERMERLS